MRFYVTSIEHNKEKNAENRSVPFGFDDFSSASQKFHEILSKDIKNATLDWAMAIMFDEWGNPLKNERWDVNAPVTREELIAIMDGEGTDEERLQAMLNALHVAI